MIDRHDASKAGRDTGVARRPRSGDHASEQTLPTRPRNGLATAEREIEMNRSGGIGIIGVIVIVVVILFLVGVIKL
jgi:hypothetical protein